MFNTYIKKSGILSVLFYSLLALWLVYGCSQQSDSSADTPDTPSNSISVDITSPDTEIFNVFTTSTDNISFTGAATDNKEGQLTGDALVWTYTVDGLDGSYALGKGTGMDNDLNDPLVTTKFPPGHYVVRLTAINSAGDSNYTEKNLVVNHYPTQVAITSPAAGATLSVDENPLQLIGEAYDPEDGPLTDENLTWMSRSITPQSVTPFASGTNVSQAFPVGLHTLRLLAKDSNDMQISTTIRFSVVDRQNDKPIATITEPIDATIYQAGTAITMQGSALDFNQQPLTGNALVWSSSIDGLLGYGADISCSDSSATCGKFLSPGTHTIMLTATDSGFQSASKTVMITVKAPVPTDDPPVNLMTDNGFIDTGIEKGSLLPDNVKLDLAASDDSGLSGYYITVVDDGRIPAAPAPTANDWISENVDGTVSYSDTLDYALVDTYPLGTDVTVYVWFKDNAGQLSSYAKDTIRYLDVAKPVNLNASGANTDFINGGDAVTYSKNVNLSLNAEDLWGIAAYYIAEGIGNASTPPPATDPGWVYVSPTKNYTAVAPYSLKGNYDTDNMVTLSVWFKDAANNISENVASDTILYSKYVATANFDAGLEKDWTASGDWQTGIASLVGPAACNSGQCAGTIMNGFYTRQESILTSPEIDLPNIWQNEQIQLSLDQWHNFYYSTGGHMMGGASVIDYGYVEIAQIGLGGVLSNWAVLKSYSGFSGGWQNLTLPLTAYSGKTVKLRLRLRPDVNSGLGYAGWYLDNFTIQVN